MWNTQVSVTLEDLMNSIRGIVARPNKKICLYFWDGSDYFRLRLDADLMNASTRSCKLKGESITRIYITFNKTSPSKIYGKPPYDDVFEIPDFGTEPAENVPSGQTTHRSPTTKGLRRTTVATMQGNSESSGYKHNHRTRPKYSRSTEDISPNVHFPSSKSSVASQPYTPKRKLSYQPMESPWQPATPQVGENDLEVAVSTLRSMGYNQDASILKYHITASRGNLNEIIDRLH